MKQVLWIFLAIIICTNNTSAQEQLAQASGNTIYSQQGGNSVYNSSTEPRREVASGNVSISPTAVIMEANILMNVKAAEYIATFSVSQECRDALDCNKSLDLKLNQFIANLQALGIQSDSVFIDFVAQNKIYDYDVSANLAKEKQVGFELKKNIIVYYKDKNLLDKMVVEAAKSDIYDLAKVEYLVPDTANVRKKLLEEALRIIKEKETKYATTFGFKFRSIVLIEREKYDVYFPSQMYRSYNAYEASRVRNDININTNVNINSKNSQYRIQEARKSTTFFYNPLNAEGFDQVINPIVNEPVVQFTLFFRTKYELDR